MWSRPDLLLLFFLVWPGAGTATGAISVGDKFPPLSTLVENSGVPASDGRVTLVDFWASWCAPCEASFPALARIHSDYAPKGLMIVAVSVDEKPAPFAAFVKKRQPPFTTVRDAGQALVRIVKVPVMPTSYLIGRDGRVRFVHRGFHGAESEKELRQHIDVVLAEPIN